MQINNIRNQSFGMNPSNVLRSGLAQEIVKGRNVDEFMNLIGELYPYRFMNALTEGNKFFWVGATKRFERKPQMLTYIKTETGEKILEPVRREDFNDFYMSSYRYYKKEHDRLLAKYPSRVEIKDAGEEFITFFKDVKGKLFSEIVEPIVAKLKAIKASYNPTERAYLKIANKFPEYADIPNVDRVKNMANTAAGDANWMNTPIG